MKGTSNHRCPAAQAADGPESAQARATAVAPSGADRDVRLAKAKDLQPELDAHQDGRRPPADPARLRSAGRRRRGGILDRHPGGPPGPLQPMTQLLK